MAGSSRKHTGRKGRTAQDARNDAAVQANEAPAESTDAVAIDGKKGLTLHVVSHTHWDREWYLTYQRFRMRLVEVIDNVLHTLDTDPAFRCFHLDGQTIVLEDYLQVRPQNEQRVRRYVREGRLLVGPWYQLMDEFLVSGESIVRSLFVGRRIARDFGSSMPVGYLADQFGNISQMPQILRGFGIDNCILGRGIQLEYNWPVEFVWRSPDGSAVLCSLMAWWYNNAQRIPAEEEPAREFILRIAGAMTPHCRSGQLLLMNGVDHLDVQDDVAGIIAELDGKLPGMSIRHSSLPEYIAAVKDTGIDLPVFEGEMREDRGGSVLAGVLSSRLYLKQANSRCECLLEREAEPLASLAFIHGELYDRDFFRYAWKLLMWNHPHDSICGCSHDQVHREMVPRFDEVEQIGEDLALRAAHAVAARVDCPSPALVVFNTLGFHRTDLVHAQVDFPLGPPTRDGVRPGRDPGGEGFSLWDDVGREVVYQVSDVEVVAQSVLSPIELPLVQWVKRFHIKFIGEDIPSLGYRTYRVDPFVRKRVDSPSLAPYANALENESLLLEIAPDGTLHLLEKATERDYEGANAFEDGGDCGDEYHYRPPLRDEVVCTARAATARVSMVECGPVLASYRVDLDLDLPVRRSPDGRGRSPERQISRISSLVSLAAGSSRVEICTTIENASSDHRLRVLFPTGIVTEEATAEGQFDVITRRSRPPADWAGAAPTRPQQSFVDISDDADGLCILNRGLTEYELLDDQDGTLAITLLRCVGFLSGSGDGPGIATPDAQCLGKRVAHYALFPHAGDWLDARVWQEGHAFRTPLRCVQKGAAYAGELDTVHRQHWRRGHSDIQTGTLPTNDSLLEIQPEFIIVSAVKVAEERDSLVVRIYNMKTEPVESVLVPGFECSRAWRVNLDEDRLCELPVTGGRITLELGIREIGTIELEGDQIWR